MKLCKDCKWMKDPGEFAKCTAPQNIECAPGTLTGFAEEPQYKITYCSTQRRLKMFDAWLLKRCGQAGKWFEPK